MVCWRRPVEAAAPVKPVPGPGFVPSEYVKEEPSAETERMVKGAAGVITPLTMVAPGLL